MCRKHVGEISIPGGAVYEDDPVYAGHAAIPEGQATAYLGSLMVEPKRHISGLAELTDEEAQNVGLLIARLSRALKTSEGAEHVYMFVLGHAVPHLHIWIVPRYSGTPREYWGMRVDEWPHSSCRIQRPRPDTPNHASWPFRGYRRKGSGLPGWLTDIW